ncbi:MAG: hypothetical protein JSU87_09660 [Gemmatimonadota bacterium]|nr:MAG: hypothetical protein JSU87_09660 [Gemmatimonadota bacterium]
MKCPVCGERDAAPQYYRLNRLDERIEQLCRTCWMTLRKVGADDWSYFRGAARLILFYTILPVAATALAVWLIAMWIL